MKARFAVIIIFIILSLNCYCQNSSQSSVDNPQKTDYAKANNDSFSYTKDFLSEWVEAGIGGNKGLTSASIGIYENYSRRNVISLKYTSVETSLFYSNKGIDRFTEWSLSHGWMDFNKTKTRTKTNICIIVFAGVALLKIDEVKRNPSTAIINESHDSNYQPALTGQFKAMFIPLPFLSIGGSISGNLNFKQNYIVVAAEIGIGKFR